MKYKDDIMSFVLTIVGGLILAIIIFVMVFLTSLDNGLIELIGISSFMILCLPILLLSFLVLGVARVIELLNRILQEMNYKH